MDRNRITRTGARTPGEERHRPLEWRCLERTTAPTQSGDQQVGKRRARRKDANHEGATTGRHSWEGPFDKPTLKPYWGKPAVRNFRGDDGNVGIIRSPVRAIALPDQEVSCNVVGAARDSVPYHQGFGSHAVLARQLLTAIE